MLFMAEPAAMKSIQEMMEALYLETMTMIVSLEARVKILFMEAPVMIIYMVLAMMTLFKRGQSPAQPAHPAPARPVSASGAPADPNFVGVPMTELRVGERVEHNRFGAGVIKSISGTAPDMKATIVFDEFGEKLLLLKYAKLRPLKKDVN